MRNLQIRFKEADIMTKKKETIISVALIAAGIKNIRIEKPADF